MGSGWETRLICWKPPIDGRVKLNTDGARKVGGCAGCCGLIRGSDGYARRMSHRFVDLNVDSLVVAQAIQRDW
ncbi:hypothetical protein L195_g045293, partial [Trifolium pratense]